MVLSRAAPYLALLLALGLIVGAVSAEQEKPIVVATTTVLGSVVEDLAGDRVQ
ncbi:MAG TPA: metal ABC transporter substrate-binding protein, partial [Nitrososphaeria archaeon]|nr:metal ABC transporter substrate-binding protein [Nitrososphaeria archaeon]